jgi:phage regulator Rha-like protein
MSDLIVSSHTDGVLVVDSRLVAKELGIQHENFMDTLKKYQTEAEQAFGVLRFETGKPPSGSLGGRPEKFAFLTEEQATFYATLSRNTPEVVQLKAKIVKAFFEARRLLQSAGITQPTTTTAYIQRLQNMSDHNVADDVWTAFREGAEVLLKVEVEFRVPVSKMDLCDGSIGSHWSKYRNEAGFTSAPRRYTHRFRDHRGDREANAFEYSELPVFRKWLREIYIPQHLPSYLVDKYGKRAVLQIYEEQKQLNEHILKLTEEKRTAPKQEELYQIFLAARDAMSPSRYLPS